MEKANLTIRSFTDLNSWKEGHKLVLMIYLETKNFLKEEKYDLISQIRRAVVSITSNIAEGLIDTPQRKNANSIICRLAHWPKCKIRY